MKKLFPTIILTLCLAGCGAGSQNLFESNPNFSDKNMGEALEREMKFCVAASRGEVGAYTHVSNLPPRDFRENFSLSARALGYADRRDETQKSLGDYAAAYAFTHNISAKQEEERVRACLRHLGWKRTKELSGSERQRLDKNNRVEALMDKIGQDPLSGKSVRLMAANMDHFSHSQAEREREKLFADPENFEEAYMSARREVRGNREAADSRILASDIGADFARCSAMYGLVNEQRQDSLKQKIMRSDRLRTMERECFAYASRLLHVDVAEMEKLAYARKVREEAGPGLSVILLRLKEESSQCSTLLQRFKQMDAEWETP